MVEELIAEGWSPSQIVHSLVTENGMTRDAAELYVITSLGGPGDVVIEEVDELIAASWDERTVLEPGYGEEMLDVNDWSVTATGWEGETLPALISEVGPDVADLAMIAVYPRMEEQGALAMEDGHASEKLHTTLVFLGEADSFDHDAVLDALAGVAGIHDPLEGKVGGTGKLAAGPDGAPLIALPSVRGLAELRDDIVEALAARGIESPSEHGWTPHITLTYVEDGDTAEAPEALNVPLHFDTVSFVVADERIDVPLRARALAPVEDQNGHAVAAVMGMIGEKWSEMVGALTSLGNRPVVVEMPRELTAALGERQDIIVNVPEQPVQITVEQPAITVEAPNVTVEPAQITVEAPAVTVEVAAAEVSVPPAEVTVVVEREPAPDRKITFNRDPGTGRIESAEVEDEAG